MKDKTKKPAPIAEKQDKIPTIIKLAQENKYFGVPKRVENENVTISLKSMCQKLKGRKI